MAPEDCWRTWASFLLKHLGLSPFGVWNVLILPRDEASSEALDMLAHPGIMSELEVDEVNSIIGRLVAHVEAVHRDINERIDAGEEADMELVRETEQSARLQMRKLALAIGRDAVGEITLKRSAKMFLGAKKDQRAAAGAN